MAKSASANYERFRSQPDSPIFMAAFTLVAYSVLVALLTGDIGFEGDDWWIFSWAYWNAFPDSLLVYARESLRPVEGIYWITLFELFGFNKIAFHLGSLLLLAGAGVLMGLSLSRAFPGRHTLALTATFLAFFMPTVSCLTYVMTTDNSRLSLLLFWGSVLAYQRWAGRSATWLGLLVPVSLYIVAFLTYEAATLLIFTIPLLVLPIHFHHPNPLPDKTFMSRLALSIAGGLLIAIAIRFTFLNGGAVVHRHVAPPTELIWSYLALLPFYVMEPFRDVSTYRGAWSIATGVTLVCAALIYWYRDTDSRRIEPDTVWWKRVSAYPALLGVAMLFLGMLPYQIAGYGSVIPKIVESVMLKWGVIPDGNSAWFNFNWSSRIYSSATFGLAILIASIVDCWRAEWMRWISRIVVVVAIGFFALFHAGQIPDWQEAARTRAYLSRDLLDQVPDVKGNTNFAFLNLDARHGRGVVFRGWMGLRALVRMLYDEPSLGAWYMYPDAFVPPNHIFQQAFITPGGFVSRGMKLDEPVPHESLLVFNRVDRDLTLLDSIGAGDELARTGISWDGTYAIRSNRTRVHEVADLIADPRRASLNRELRAAIGGRGTNVTSGLKTPQ